VDLRSDIYIAYNGRIGFYASKKYQSIDTTVNIVSSTNQS